MFHERVVPQTKKHKSLTHWIRELATRRAHDGLPLLKAFPCPTHDINIRNSAIHPTTEINCPSDQHARFTPLGFQFLRKLRAEHLVRQAL
eukprot:9474422-Pyramimonas_sp.AAC.1